MNGSPPFDPGVNATCTAPLPAGTADTPVGADGGAAEPVAASGEGGAARKRRRRRRPRNSADAATPTAG